MGDSEGGGDSGGGDSSSGMSKTTVGIIVGVAAVAVVLVALACWWCRRRRKKREGGEGTAEETDGSGVGPAGGVKIHTLGSEYRQLAPLDEKELRKMSILYPQSSVASEKDAPTGLRGGEMSAQAAHNGTTGNYGHNAEELDGSVIDVTKHLLPQSAAATAASTASRNRKDSTYLYFDGDNGHAPASRQGSANSHHFTMQEIHRKTTGDAPLAQHDSLHSLSASKDSSVDKIVSNLASGPKSGKRSHQKQHLLSATGHQSLPRPQSEYTSESARFVPKLPPKKKRALQHKSAANMSPADDPSSRPAISRLASSMSETCITDLVDMDYDELPEEDRQPILPPKTKPLLPPKQKINKSQDDLARIESQFRTSISDLKVKAAAAGEEDYDDLPEEERGKEEAGGEARAEHEFEDYDDPVVHVVVTAAGGEGGEGEEDYDDPPTQLVPAFGREDEDYDDPPGLASNRSS